MTTMYFPGEDPDLTDKETGVRQRDLDDDYLSVDYRGIGESDESVEETIVDLDAEFYGTGEQEDDEDEDERVLPCRRRASVAFNDLDHYANTESVSRNKRTKTNHGKPIQASLFSFLKAPEPESYLEPTQDPQPIVVGEFRLVSPAVSQMINDAIQNKELQQMLGGLTL